MSMIQKIICVRQFFISIIALCFFIIRAEALESRWVSYIGADLQSRHMKFAKPYSTGVDKNDYLQGNLYLGLRCNDFFGLEFGFERAMKKSENPNLPFSASCMGEDNTTPEGTAIKTKTILEGYHSSVVAFLPLGFIPDSKLIAILGLARARIKTTLDSYEFDSLNPADQGWNRPYIFKKSRWIPRLGIGTQIMVNHHFGLRVLCILEKTSQYSYIVESRSARRILLPKNSIIPSVGIFYKF